MTITKAVGPAAAVDAASTATLTTATFDSTGFTHLVVFFKHEGASTTETPSDNKGSTGWTSETKKSNSVNDSWGQFHWVKIGTPGTGHTVTMTLGAARPYKTLILWKVNSTLGTLAVVSSVQATGNNTTPVAGTLSNAGADSIVSFQGVAEYAAVNYTVGSGWTSDFTPTGGNFTYGQSRGAETTTSISATCTCDATQDWASCAVAFKETAAADVLMGQACL